MVVITIISLLAAAAVPTVVKVKRRSLAAVVANDMRVFGAAFDAYAHEVGGWPAEVDAGVLPPEMASRLNSGAWLKPTPLGGQFNWDFNQTHAGTAYRAVVAISSTSASPVVQDADLLEAIDSVLDDGVLTTGNFRIGADDEPIFIVAVQ
jgi:type II secretory pathway pseudopilin PulG